MEVAVYLRKSREEENETREETLARHERMLKDYCDNKNLIIKKIYKEVVSGENIANRPQMQRLLEDVQDKLYDGVVVIEIERLSRGNQIDQAEILEIFKKSNTKIFTLNKTYDLSDENEFDEDFFEFGLFMSRREYKIIKRRLLRGKKQAQKEGYFIGSQCPFGYSKEKRNKGYILIPDDNSKIVQTIFNKYAYDNNSLADIRNYLNSNGIKPNGSRSSEWESYRIKRILKNKVYIGFINYDTKNTNNTHEGKHEPIIDEHTFWLVQEKLNVSSTKVKKSKELKNPLASLLKCGICGKTMQRFVRKNKPTIYNCPRAGCSNIMSNCDLVEKKVINELKEELKGFNYFLDNYGEELQNKKNQIEVERKIILNEISKKESMIDKACEMLELGVYTKEKYLSRVNILENDLKALKTNLEGLNMPLDDDERVIKAIPILENVLNEYWNLSIEGKNAILKSIISKIEYLKTEKNPNSNKLNENLDLINLKIYLKI